MTPAGGLQGDEAVARFEALTDALLAYAPIWRVNPWRTWHPAWTDDHPALAAWLRGLPADRVLALEDDPGDPAALPPPFADLVRTLAPLTALPVFDAPPVPLGPAARMRDRKAAQIRALTAVALPHLRAADRVVEWCSGRGHLGRALAGALGVPGLLLERDPALCGPPPGEHERPGVAHRTIDVTTPEAAAALRPGDATVALHACGTLTDLLLDAATATGVRHLIAAPCCYHRLIGRDAHRPRSAPGRARDLRLVHDDLRVVTREATCAGARRTRLRARELVARAAWDLWRREATGQDRHHPAPALVRSTFDEPLSHVLHAWREAAGIDDNLPETSILEASARARVLEIRALDLPRIAFRRALELWINLDRLIGLSEDARPTELGTFCSRTETPRNLALISTAPPR